MAFIEFILRSSTTFAVLVVPDESLEISPLQRLTVTNDRPATKNTKNSCSTDRFMSSVCASAAACNMICFSRACSRCILASCSVRHPTQFSRPTRPDTDVRRGGGQVGPTPEPGFFTLFWLNFGQKSPCFVLFLIFEILSLFHENFPVFGYNTPVKRITRWRRKGSHSG